MNLFYRHIGSGEPVIILHGFLGLSDNWLPFGKKLAENFSVYIPDLRNHGLSPNTNLFDYPSLVDDLEKFISDNNIVNPIVIGHSMGGKIAMNYTLRHPDKVKKLIVIDISMRKYPVLSQQIEVIDTMLKIDASGIESYRELRRVIAEVVKSERQQQLVLKNLKKDGKNGFVWKIAIESLRRNMSNIYEAVEKNGVFEKEALFVSGGRSGYITDEDINEIKLFFTEALVEIIPEASHWVHVDAPDKLLKLVKEFVTY